MARKFYGNKIFGLALDHLDKEKVDLLFYGSLCSFMFDVMALYGRFHPVHGF